MYDADFAYLAAVSPKKGQRTSVSAEAWEAAKPAVFEAPVYPKTDEQVWLLAQVLRQQAIFNGLDQDALMVVVHAMCATEAQPGELLIREGEEGDYLFVVDVGELECTKEGVGFLKTYVQGEVFGELALLYNCPRTATIMATVPSRCWKLDRASFNHIVRDAAANRLERYRSFVSSVSLLRGLDTYEQTKLAEALRAVAFPPGSVIIQQGDVADDMFFIERGSVQAIARREDGSEVSFTHTVGDYFGELALLYNQARSATVVALDDVECLVVDRRTFTGLLGSLKGRLLNESQRYSNADATGT
jgi:cAMP-dependent protein kinase regulator